MGRSHGKGKRRDLSYTKVDNDARLQRQLKLTWPAKHSLLCYVVSDEYGAYISDTWG